MQEPRIRGERSSPDSRRVESDSRRRSRRSRSRSRSKSRSHHHSSSQREDYDRQGNASRDYVRPSQDRHIRLTDRENDKLDRLVAQQVQELAQQQVSSYMESDDFKAMVESFKRRERQRILTEIEQELAQEKAVLLAEGRQKLATEYIASMQPPELPVHTSHSADQLSSLTAAEQAAAILLQNKIKMEEQQRRNYEAKQKEDAERLQHVLYRKQIEDMAEKQRLEALMREQELLDEVMLESSSSSAVSDTAQPPLAVISASSKLSFGLKKRNALS